MRFDSLGLFWEDAATIKIPKAPKPKREAPDPVWLKPDYLPHLQIARATVFNYLSDRELIESSIKRDLFSMDVESYPNYFLVGFRRIRDKKIVVMERIELNGKVTCDIDKAKVKWCLENLLFCTFNGNSFDLPWCQIMLLGHDCEFMHDVTQQLIKNKEDPGYQPSWMIKKKYKAVKLKCDHIDLIEVAPGTMTSLKIYGGRYHAKRLQDLPFNPLALLSFDQIVILRWYWNNDLDTTEGLYAELEEQIGHRIALGKRYGLDLRSKSDAQVAEAILVHEAKKALGVERIEKAKVKPGSVFSYRPPSFIKFRTAELKQVLLDLATADFEIDSWGYVISPVALDGPIRTKKGEKPGRVITINKTRYRMGIGGLHSDDDCMALISGGEFQLWDWDVTSYYPNLMLNTGLYPDALGPSFSITFRGITDERMAAKARGDDILAQLLKIVANGTFGKTGSPFSMLYGPDLMIQTTVTGQLMLLMLVERMEWAGIQVASANTDGILVKCPTGRDADMRAIIKQWEQDTGFQMEDTKYKAMYSRDVNNYIAVYDKPKKGEVAKTKGAFGNSGLMKNPTGQIASEAAVAKLVHGIPVEKTIIDCTDIRKFVHLRTVKGGGVKDGEYLGKVVRWYIAANESSEIVYAKTGNKVAKSDGARPIMALPDKLPDDINYDWYIQEANKILASAGYN